MEIGKRLNPKHIFNALYVVAFLVYVVVGLQPAEATNYTIDTKLLIPSISLESDVTKLQLEKNGLNTPDEIVGSFSAEKNKTLLIGHASTVFSHLNEVNVGDIVSYYDKKYSIIDKIVLDKQDIFMADLLESAKTDTLVIMTCAGEMLENGDATQRLLLFAEKL